MKIFFHIIFLPLIGAFCSGLLGRPLGRTGAPAVAVSLMTVNLILTISLILEYFTQPQVWYLKSGTWMSSELLQIYWSFQMDSITLTMFFVVNLVSCLVHYYSWSYMSEDPHLPRFMSYISLFTFFMLILVSADNLIQLFLGWEGVGVCSYLLIGFWFTRIQANKSALKALIVNRISDVALTLGIIICFCTFRDISFPVIFSLTPYFLEQNFFLGGMEFNVINTITVLFVIGAMGKSAQIFLHTWLPDAMEGPTPVSALIHAATMVTAGVFLIIKCSPIFEYSRTTLLLLCFVGGLTALFSSMIGLVQYDIKKVIAYSTCSQLGYMVFACGLSAYHVSLFHLTNHALFKALLFLSAGSIIHSLSNEQDMRRMGGLTKLLPIAYACLTIGSLALIGFPFLTGYYSKDVILELAYSQYQINASFVHWLGTITAFFTSFYSFRLAYLTFISQPKLHKTIANNIHESDHFIFVPLTILAIGSIFFGYLTKDLFVGLGSPWFAHSMLILPTRNSMVGAEFLPFYIKNLPFFYSCVSLLLVWVLYSVVRKYGVYYQITLQKIHQFLTYKWYFDWIYNYFINHKLLKVGFHKTYVLLDRGIFEWFGPNGLYYNISSMSNGLKVFENGRMYYYAAYILLSFLLCFFLLISFTW